MSKQKASRKATLKRHLSLNEVQGISNELSKKRQTTDINIVDPFNDQNNKIVSSSAVNIPLKNNLLDVSAINDFLSTTNNSSTSSAVGTSKSQYSGKGVNLCQSLNDLISITNSQVAASTLHHSAQLSKPPVLNSNQQAMSSKIISDPAKFTVS